MRDSGVESISCLRGGVHTWSTPCPIITLRVPGADAHSARRTSAEAPVALQRTRLPRVGALVTRGGTLAANPATTTQAESKCASRVIRHSDVSPVARWMREYGCCTMFLPSEAGGTVTPSESREPPFPIRNRDTWRVHISCSRSPIPSAAVP